MASAKSHVTKFLKGFLPGQSPNFIIVGAQKSGTTSLHYYLDQHPDITGSQPKEVRYFDRDENYYHRDQNWYEKAFIDIKRPFKGGHFFEATPEYLYRKSVPERIYNYDPNMKIIILLREPVARAYSSWNMYKSFPSRPSGLPKVFYSGYYEDKDNNIMKELYSSNTFPSFELCVESEMKKIKLNSELEEPSFLRRGIYLPQIKRYHKYFGRGQVLILGFKDLIQYQEKTLNEILDFLGIQKNDWSFLNNKKRNSRSYGEKINKQTETYLKDFYAPYNEHLYQYLEKKINW